MPTLSKRFFLAIALALPSLFLVATDANAWQLFPRQKIMPYHFGRWTVSPSVYGWKLDVASPGYYGGLRYNEFYNFGRGFGLADFPDSLPNYTGSLFRPRWWPYPWNQWPVPQEYDFNSNCCQIIIHVPPDAELWLDGRESAQTGTMRVFTTPPLTGNQQSVCRIRARWPEGRGRREQFHDVPIQAGQQILVRFPLGSDGTEATTPPTLETVPVGNR